MSSEFKVDIMPNQRRKESRIPSGIALPLMIK
jgi:hypothetical protein